MVDNTAPTRLTGIAPAQQVLLDALHAHDLAMLDAAYSLASVDRKLPHDAAPTDWVLAVDAGLRRADRGQLRTVSLLLPHLPALEAAVRDQRCSFDVLATICQRARSHRLTTDQLALLDRHAAALLADGRWDADDLHGRLVDAMVAIRPDEAEAAENAVEEAVWLSPRLFGGGDIHVTANTEHYQLVTSTLTKVMRGKQTLDSTKLTKAAGAVDADEAWVANSKVIAEARATALFAMCADVLDGHRATAADCAMPASNATGAGSVAVRPAMHVVVTADALASLSDEPARMLLSGQRVTAGRLRALALRNGADVEAVVTGRDGTVLDVGRRSRLAPAKLARLLTALQPTCVVPSCRTRVADVDHAVAWRDGGRTDLDNLARLCRAHHTAKHDGKQHQGQFHLEPDDAGRVAVRHRSGWTSTHRPPTTGPPPPTRPEAERARSSPPVRPPRLRRSAPPRDPTDGDDLPF